MTSYNTKGRGAELLAVNTTFCIIAVCTVILRCYVRARLIKAFGIDDWMMVMATAFLITSYVVSNCGIHYGIGQHVVNLEKQNIERAVMYWWFSALFYILTMITAKISFAFFLLRFTVTRIQSWVVYTAALCTAVTGIAYFFATLFQCRPISLYWNKSQRGKCLEWDVIIALAYLYSVSSLVTDVTFVLLPGFLIWNLQLKRRAKCAAIGLIGMGCIACFAVAVRFKYIAEFNNPDFLWATVDMAIWSTVEMGLAISAASSATLRPLVKYISRKLGPKSPLTISYRVPQCESTPLDIVPNELEIDSQFHHRPVYVLTELHRDTSRLARGTSQEAGTQAVHYADTGKESLSVDVIVDEFRK